MIKIWEFSNKLTLTRLFSNSVSFQQQLNELKTVIQDSHTSMRAKQRISKNLYSPLYDSITNFPSIYHKTNAKNYISATDLLLGIDITEPNSSISLCSQETCLFNVFFSFFQLKKKYIDLTRNIFRLKLSLRKIFVKHNKGPNSHKFYGFAISVGPGYGDLLSSGLLYLVVFYFVLIIRDLLIKKCYRLYQSIKAFHKYLYFVYKASKIVNEIARKLY